jgi:tetratricopeptide (TPR) repeat protein
VEGSSIGRPHSVRRWGRILVLAFSLLFACPSLALPDEKLARVPTASSQFGGSSIDVESPELLARLPGASEDPGLRELWVTGMRLEQSEELVASAEYYERIVKLRPEAAFTYWRIARNYWRQGESLPFDAKDERIAYFAAARDWAQRGIDADSGCGECMLWKFVAMGRLATTKGLLSAVRTVSEMGSLLDRGIALEPDYADSPDNTALGNLYYSGAVFYRVVPDSLWVSWIIGVRGDKEKSLDYIRKAVAISDRRVDYRVELGAVLLCLGVEKENPGRLVEGTEVLREARKMKPYLSTDYLDLGYAQRLIDSPELACGFSRDGFIDVDGVIESRGDG